MTNDERNNYSYGNFKGNASEWMAKYFDAFHLRALYLAWVLSAQLGELDDGDMEVEAATRLARLREEHAKKPSLIERFRKAGLTT